MSDQPYDLSDVRSTIAFVNYAHATQVDKAGLPYVLHPLRVGAALTRFGDDAIIAGMLHDVVEDTVYELSDLRRMGASAAVVSAVDSVTKHKSEALWSDYAVTIRRALLDPVGRWVKAADVEDNAGRLDALPEGQMKDRLVLKYRRAVWLLEEELPGYRSGRPLCPPVVAEV